MITQFGSHEAAEGAEHQYGGWQYIFEFENGYGASVIRGAFSYGGSNGLWEVAVLADGILAFDTPITDGVIGYLSDDEVTAVLDRIKAMPPFIPTKPIGWIAKPMVLSPALDAGQQTAVE